MLGLSLQAGETDARVAQRSKNGENRQSASPFSRLCTFTALPTFKEFAPIREDVGPRPIRRLAGNDSQPLSLRPSRGKRGAVNRSVERRWKPRLIRGRTSSRIDLGGSGRIGANSLKVGRAVTFVWAEIHRSFKAPRSKILAPRYRPPALFLPTQTFACCLHHWDQRFQIMK